MLCLILWQRINYILKYWMSAGSLKNPNCIFLLAPKWENPSLLSLVFWWCVPLIEHHVGKEANFIVEQNPTIWSLGSKEQVFPPVCSATLDKLQNPFWLECAHCSECPNPALLAGQRRAAPEPTQSGRKHIPGKETLLSNTMTIQPKQH